MPSKLKIVFKDKLDPSRSSVTLSNVSEGTTLISRKEIGTSRSIAIPYSMFKNGSTYKAFFEIHDVGGRVKNTKYVTFTFSLAASDSLQNEMFMYEFEVSRPDVFCWPVPGYNRVTSEFGLRDDPVEKKQSGRKISQDHKAIDIGAPKGATVVSTQDGKVVIAKNSDTAGLYVVVEHKGGFKSRYLHLNKIFVKVGQVVKMGQTIGEVGNTGRSTAPHLHFEIIFNGNEVDPSMYLNISLPPSPPPSNQSIISSPNVKITTPAVVSKNSYVIPEAIRNKYPQQTMFISEIYPHALKVNRDTGIPWQVMVAQACLESGYGKSEIRDLSNPLRRTYNIFGIKYRGTGEDKSNYAEAWTTEKIFEEDLEKFRVQHPEMKEIKRYVDANTKKMLVQVKIIAKFQAFTSFEEAFSRYKETLLNKHFKHALKSKHDPILYIKDVQSMYPGELIVLKDGKMKYSHPRYATDDNYVDSITRLMKMYKMI